MQYIVTDKNFGPYRRGEVKPLASGLYQATLDYTAANGPNSYAAPGYTNYQGMIYLISHEVTHMLRGVNDYYNSIYNEVFPDVVSNPTEAKWFANEGGWFGRTETFTNTVGREFLKAMDAPTLTSPTFGYWPM